MAHLSAQSIFSVSRGKPAGNESVCPGDPEMSNFDLRDALADMTVRETSFTEFLAALRQAGYRPA